MSPEKFNPSDQKYKKVEDLPRKHQAEFADIPQGEGFTRKEALSESEAFERSRKIREKLEQESGSLFRGGDVEKVAESYEEAELLVESDTLKEKLGNSPELGEAEKKELYSRDNLLLEAKGHIRYLNRLNAEPKDEGVFWSEIQSILTTKSYEVFTQSMRDEFLEKYGKFAVLHGDHTIKFRMLDVYGHLGMSDSLVETFKGDFIARGEYDLYIKLLKTADRQVDQSELTKLGEQALFNKSPHDAVRALEYSGRDDLISKAASLETERTLTAEIKNEKMPNGLKTKGWMSHSTQYTYLANILLKDGILSNTEILKQYGKLDRYFLRNHLQQFWSAYNYISVFDPWYGYSYNRSEEDTEYGKKMKEDFNKFLWDIVYVWDADDNIRVRPEIKLINGKTPDTSSLKVEESADPQFEQIFRKVEDFFEKHAKVKESMPDAEWRKNINLSYLFSSWGGGKPNLIIDPNRERFTTYESGFGPESFVKNKIDPSEIVGLVVPKEAEGDEYLFNWLLKLAKQSGTPLYLSDVPEQNHTDEQLGIEQIWPKKITLSESDQKV